jgi:hypothetical protein
MEAILVKSRTGEADFIVGPFESHAEASDYRKEHLEPTDQIVAVERPRTKE